MRKKRRTVRQIIEAAGGADKVSLALGEAVTPGAVYKWFRIGIPDRHWPAILPMAGASADELLAANIAARTQTEVCTS